MSEEIAKLVTPICQTSVIVSFYEHGFHINALVDASPQDEMSDPEGTKHKQTVDVANRLQQVVFNYLNDLTKSIQAHEQTKEKPVELNQ